MRAALPNVLPIVGSYYRPPAKAILSVLPVGTALTLRPEPENKVDRNAIAVWIASADVPESCHGSLMLAGADTGFRISADGDRAEDNEDFLNTILLQDEWHLGYVPAVLAAQMHLRGDTPATLAFTLDGKPGAERAPSAPIATLDLAQNLD